MKIKTSELSGLTLDWAVATILGYSNLRNNAHRFDNSWVMTPPRPEYGPVYLADISYSTDPTQAYSIIFRETISVWETTPSISAEEWSAITDIGTWAVDGQPERYESFGETPLIAAMRAFVASKLGDEVDVPDELCTSPS